MEKASKPALAPSEIEAVGSLLEDLLHCLFLRRHDLRPTQQRLASLVLKIETLKGFENLPSMLLAAMRWPSCGVMIARGDLAVECGYERLAQKGLPSRAEISDVVMAHRAECVMLNKGPHISEAVDVLDNILNRMQSHQRKKRAMLRELRLAH